MTTHSRIPAANEGPHSLRPAASVLALPAICWRQWRTERALRKRDIAFRTNDSQAARHAYTMMNANEFAAINGRQAWSNARTIARSLAGLIADRPLRVLDLGSGIGQSTAVLASFLPAGSQVLGIEFAESLVEVARERVPRDLGGVSIAFVVGSATATYCDQGGAPIGDGQIDLVNASGIVGHHFTRHDAELAAREIARVQRSDGIAALDVGPELDAATLIDIMSQAGFAALRRTRSNPFDRTGQVVFRRLPEIDPR